MEFLTQLWLPILVSAVVVFVLSFLLWAVLPFHHKDYKTVPDEAGLTAYLKGAGIPAGNYAFPNCATSKEKRGEEFTKRWKEGPTGLLSVWPNNFSMGRNLALTFLVFLVVSVLIGYLASHALGRAVTPMAIFRFAGTAGVLAYSFAFLPNGIWFNATPSALVRNIVDGVVYGLATGAVFALLWPGA